MRAVLRYLEVSVLATIKDDFSVQRVFSVVKAGVIAGQGRISQQV